MRAEETELLYELFLSVSNIASSNCSSTWNIQNLKAENYAHFLDRDVSIRGALNGGGSFNTDSMVAPILQLFRINRGTTN